MCLFNALGGCSLCSSATHKLAGLLTTTCQSCDLSFFLAFCSQKTLPHLRMLLGMAAGGGTGG